MLTEPLSLSLSTSFPMDHGGTHTPCGHSGSCPGLVHCWSVVCVWGGVPAYWVAPVPLPRFPTPGTSQSWTLGALPSAAPASPVLPPSPGVPSPAPILTCFSICCSVRQKKQRQWIGPTEMNQNSECPRSKPWRLPLVPASLLRGLTAASRCLCTVQAEASAQDGELSRFCLWNLRDRGSPL